MHELIHNVSGHLSFWLQRIFLYICVADDGNLIRVVAETRTSITKRVEYDEVEVLALQLALSMSHLIIGLESKAYELLVRLFHAPQLGSDVVRGLET